MIEIIAPALALSVVLLGIHAWFGLEILRRGIIFTDLAIGQMAALGTALAIVALGEPSYAVSLSIALMAAGLISLAARKERVNLEAFIGLIYAVGISGGYLLLSSHPHGMEQFNMALAGDLLFTPWADVAQLTALYIVVSIALRYLFVLGSERFREASFFVLFAVTVTSAVKAAGALVVFALLIAPAFIVTALGLRNPLLWAWLGGVALCGVAIFASVQYDLPTGYAIVFVHGAAGLIVGASARNVRSTKS
jgi:zinc/manganese transport system permease protein